jgi:hypothetical protein
MDGRTLTHDKSSHGLWPGELKKKRIKGYKERGMIRLQNVDKGKSNKYILNVWIHHFAGQ